MILPEPMPGELEGNWLT